MDDLLAGSLAQSQAERPAESERSDEPPGAVKVSESFADLFGWVVVLLDENKRSWEFWTALVMLVFLWVLYFVVVPFG